MREVERALTSMSGTVRNQLHDALASFRDRDSSSADQVVERDDIVDNLNGSLEERIFEAIGAAGSNISEARRWRAALRVLSNLERIGDAATHIAKHSIMMAGEPAPGIDFGIDDLADLAIQGFTEGVEGFVNQDLELAKAACERERELDELYVKKLHQVMTLLDAGEGHAQYLLHVLAAMKYLEKTADFALNIGEAVFFAVTGTRLKYPQFKQLETLLSEADRSSSNVVYRHFWDGISGAIVLEIDSLDGHRYLFKEGAKKKIDEEVDRVIEWEFECPRTAGRSSSPDPAQPARDEGAFAFSAPGNTNADEAWAPSASAVCVP